MGNKGKYNNEKHSSTHSKQKETFEELANKRMEEIQNLSKHIDFNNFTYPYKGNKGSLSFYKNIKERNKTLEIPD